MIFLRKIIKTFREAISGKEQDLTKITINKAIFLLAIPMILEMIMESVFAVVDIYFVSSLGFEAVAAVGLTESLMTIVYALAVGFSAATTAIVARRIGEKKKKEASVASVQAILIGIVASILIAIPGIIYAKDLLYLMGAEKDIVESFSSYTSIMLGGNVVIMLLFIINAVFRSAGDAALSMRVLLIANLLNIILDPLLIFGIGPFPELGVEGAAIATNLGRGIAVVYQLYILFFGKKRIQLKWSSIKLDFPIIKSILNISKGGIMQNIIATTSWIGLVRIISVFGSESVAGYTIALRVILFVLLPAWGLSNAASTLVGQNLGANKPDRAEKSVSKTALMNLIFMSSVSIILIMFPEFLISIFIDDPIVVAKGVLALRVISIGFVSYSLGMVFIQSFNGAGDTNIPMYINIVSFWIIEIPLAYLLAITLNYNEMGVYISIIVAETTIAIIAFILFKKGKWKLKQV